MAEWGWSGSNAPVGARLFGGGLNPGRPTTGPSAAALAERMRILQLYGMLPPEEMPQQPTGPQPMAPPPQMAPPPNVLERAAQGQPSGLPLPLMPGTQEALAAPMQRQNMPPGADAVPPMTWQGLLDSLPETRPAPGSVPPGVDPSRLAAPVSPSESAIRTPSDANMAPGWRDFLYGLLPDFNNPERHARNNASMEEAWNTSMRARGASGALSTSVEEPGPYMAPDNYPQPQPPVTETPPPFVEPPASPVDAANATAGVTRGVTPYARLALQDPDYAAVMAQYDMAAPRRIEEGPHDATMRLVASALAGGFSDNSPLGSLGAIPGLAAGYAREGDRARTLAQQDEDRRQRHQQGRAALTGDQENSRWQTGLQRQTFDRTSQQLEESNVLAREGLDIQRQNAGLSRTLTTMRIAALARAAGMEVGPTEMLTRAIPEMVRTSAPLMVQTEQGMSPLMLPIAPEFLRPERGGAAPAGVQMLNPAEARRRVTETLMRQPGYAVSPQALSRAVDGVLAQAYMNGILMQPEPQRQQLFRQAHRWMENRPRSGSTTLED